MTPTIAFVIPVRNDAIRLSRCLASIRAAAGKVPIEVVVADNGSTDDTPTRARTFGATVLHVPNRVVAAVRNAGVSATTAPFVAFIDADHELHPRWVDSAIRILTSTDVAAVGADYHPPADSTWVQRMYDRLRRHPVSDQKTDWLPSGNVVIRRSAFTNAGGFDEALESCEDVDLCRRLRESGGQLLSAPSLYSTHHGDPRTLRAVFLSELWRGRDNLRVTLRDARNLMGLIGLGFTISYLGALIALLIAWPFGMAVLLTAAVLLASLTAVRTLQLVRAGGTIREAVPFALAFDTARALALITRVTHGTRRKA